MKWFMSGKVVNPLIRGCNRNGKSVTCVKFGLALGNKSDGTGPIMDFTVFDGEGCNVWDMVCVIRDGMPVIVVVETVRGRRGGMRDKVIAVLPIEAQSDDRESSIAS